jgi:heat shock protein HslJ
MRRLGFALLVVLIAVAACGGRVRVPRFAEHQWRLVELDGEPVRREGDERSPRLMFRGDGRVSGFGGCNRLSGTYEARGDRLTLGPLATTKMACADVMDIESAFLGALGRVRRWKLQSGRLALLADGSSPLAVFAEGGPPK